MNLNFKEAFTFMFNDKDFLKKYLIYVIFQIFIFPLALINFLPIEFKTPLIILAMYMVSLFVSTFSSGYIFTYANSKILTNENILPDWWGNLLKFFKIGIKYFLGMILFAIPMILIFTVIGILISVVTAAISFASTPSMNMAVLQNILKIYCLIMNVPIMLLFFLGISSFIVDFRVLSFLNVKRISSFVKHNWINLFIMALFAVVWLGLIMFIYKINVVAYIIFALVTSFYMVLVFANLTAQYVRSGIEKNKN